MMEVPLALLVGLLGGALFQSQAALRAERRRSLALAESAIRISATVAEVRGAVASMRGLHEEVVRRASGYVQIAQTTSSFKDAQEIAGIDRRFQQAADIAEQQLQL